MARMAEEESTAQTKERRKDHQITRKSDCQPDLLFYTSFTSG
jgi:hypothetical protein